MNKRIPTSPMPEVANAMQGHIKRTATQANLYIPDVEQWAEWKGYAQEQGLSMSELVCAALTSYVQQECPRCKRIAAILATGSVVVPSAKVVAEQKAIANRKKADAERPINKK